MEKNDLRESKKEIPVYRVSSKATKLFFKVIKATSITHTYIHTNTHIYLCAYDMRVNIEKRAGPAHIHTQYEQTMVSGVFGCLH